MRRSSETKGVETTELTALRTAAHALAESLDSCFGSLDEVVDWVDSKMREIDKPPIGLIEACCAGRSDQAIIDALRPVSGELDEAASMRQCLGCAASALQRDDSVAEFIAAWLEQGFGFDLPIRGVQYAGDFCVSFDTEFCLASEGHSSRSRSDVVRELQRQLVDNGRRPNQLMQLTMLRIAVERGSRWAGQSHE